MIAVEHRTVRLATSPRSGRPAQPRQTMSRSLALGLAVALLAALASPARADDPEPGSVAWHERDARNMDHATGRLQDEFSNPAFWSKSFAESHQTWHRDLGEQGEEPDRPRITFGQWIPGGSTGDPFRLDWERMGRGIQVPVSFVNRNGAKLNGHLWAPADADPGSLPGIVITTGSLQAPEVAYFWAAQGLAEAGYLVLTFDVQGQGRSETFSHGDGGAPRCFDAGCPHQQQANFVDGTADALTFLVSTPAAPYTHERTHNPLHRLLDRQRIGLAGHSLGATAVTILQDVANDPAHPVAQAMVARGIHLPAVDTVVGWDNLGTSSPYTPRVPAMGQNGEYFLNVEPMTTPPDPDERLGAFERWQAAGIDTMQVALRGSTHAEWSYIPVVLPASRSGERVALHYTLAWFDRYLRGDPTALTRLTSPTFDGSADASAIGTGAYDPATGANVPHTIAGDSVADHLSFYHRSAYDLGEAGSCADVRAGC